MSVSQNKTTTEKKSEREYRKLLRTLAHYQPQIYAVLDDVLKGVSEFTLYKTERLRFYPELVKAGAIYSCESHPISNLAESILVGGGHS